ncbi:MAG: hypothetical protein JKY56_19900 [Kofleriaceae bacterium]|nr:hypothetical protein [Kofleriaceae bacterium]
MSRIIVPALLVLLANCSTLSQEADRCSSDVECEEVFGQNSTCTSDGFCVEPVAISVGDVCSSNTLPLLLSSAQPVRIDTRELSDQIREVVSCTGTETRGNDGFFAIDMEAGQKWHLHASVVGDFANPALYILRSCDERTCQIGDAIDVCDDGYDEHLSFQAPVTGRYIVGLDSRNSGGERYDVLALSPVCGNGELEHSETCDDSNTDDGDGCDSLCRAELTTTARFEVEPNDDYSSANFLTTDSLTVSGRLGGRCDFDMFAVTIPQGGSLTAQMLDQGGQPCSSLAGFEMTLIDTIGVHVLGTGSLRVGQCPSISEDDAFAQGLDAGIYYVRVTLDASLPPLDYQLELAGVVPSS